MNDDLILALIAITAVVLILIVLKYYGFIFSPHVARALKNPQYMDFKVILNSTPDSNIIEMWYKNCYVFYYTMKDAKRALYGSQLYVIHNIYKERNPNHE